MTEIRDRGMVDTDIFYLRYIGTSSATAYQRFQSDLYRTNGLYGKFIEALARMYPQQFQKYTVHEITRSLTKGGHFVRMSSHYTMAQHTTSFDVELKR